MSFVKICTWKAVLFLWTHVALHAHVHRAAVWHSPNKQRLGEDWIHHGVCTTKHPHFCCHVTGSSTLETSSGGEWNHKVRVCHNAKDIKSCCCGAPSYKLYRIMTAVADTRSLKGITMSRFFYFYFQFHCNTQMFSEITVNNPDISTNSKIPPEQKRLGRKSWLVRRKGDV